MKGEDLIHGCEPPDPIALLSAGAGCSEHLSALASPEFLGEQAIKAVSSGLNHRLVLDTAGCVMSFGKQTYGRLGRRDAMDIDEPLGPGPVDNLEGIYFAGVVAGEPIPRICSRWIVSRPAMLIKYAGIRFTLLWGLTSFMVAICWLQCLRPMNVEIRTIRVGAAMTVLKVKCIANVRDLSGD